MRNSRGWRFFYRFGLSFFVLPVSSQMQAGKMAKTRPENLPDEMLALAAILGDLRSFDALVLRYRAAAYRVAQSIAGNELAEDAVQESLLLAFKALPSIEEPAKFASWLYAIARRVALRMSQRSRRERSHRVDLDEALIEHSEAFARPLAPRDVRPDRRTP